MNVKDIVAQMFERGNAMQTFWGFYISISIGLIAFFGNASALHVYRCSRLFFHSRSWYLRSSTATECATSRLSGGFSIFNSATWQKLIEGQRARFPLDIAPE